MNGQMNIGMNYNNALTNNDILCKMALKGSEESFF